MGVPSQGVPPVRMFLYVSACISRPGNGSQSCREDNRKLVSWRGTALNFVTLTRVTLACGGISLVCNMKIGIGRRAQRDSLQNPL